MKPFNRVGQAFFLTFLGLILLSPLAFAQEATGRFVGVVYDPTDAVIAGAKVVVTNTATKISRETVTDDTGFYQILALPVGNYTVSVNHPGFRPVTTKPEHLEINQSVKTDIHLEVGQGAETIVVEGTAHKVETIDPALSSTVSEREVQNAPLNGRNTLALALLQPGVLPGDDPGNASGGGGDVGNGGSDNQLRFSIGGGRTDSNTFVLDGGLNNNLLSNAVVYNPNPDTIQEFKVLTSNFGAEYGRSSGGIVTVVTKSGTNAFHGTAFEYNRNTDYNANDFISNANGQGRPDLKRNQFGGTFGGPIKKDKLFFFVSYEQQRQTQGQVSGNTTIFSTAELQNGDFSASPNKTAIEAFLAANPFFKGNGPATIDPAKFDPIAKAYINARLVPFSASGVESFQNPTTNNPWELTAKADYEISSKDHLTATLGRRHAPRLAPGPAEISGFGEDFRVTQEFANIAYTRILSANMLNEFHATFQRNDNLQDKPAVNAPGASALGINVTPDDPTGPVRMDITPSFLIGFSGQGPSRLVDNTYAYSDTFSWTRGKHTMKFGGGFSAYQDNQVFDFFDNGDFTFSAFDSAGNPGFGAGDPFANFLVGIPQNYFQGPAAPSNIRSKATFVFGQDEWHLAHNFTLTFGLRYEYSTPKLDTKDRTFSIVPGVKSTVFPNAPVGLLFPGDKGAPRGANFPVRNNFAPRFGFAWQPFRDGKTSIRGGTGIFYDVLKAEDNFQFNGQFPFASSANLNYLQSQLPATATANYTFLSDPFGSIGSTNPFPSKPVDHNINFQNVVGTFGGTGVFFVNPDLRTPYTLQYNLSIEHEIATNTTVEAAFVGSQSRKLTGLEEVNPFDPKTLSSACPQRILNETPGNALDPCNGTSFNGSFGFLPEFTNSPRANYNALNLSLTRRTATVRYLGTTSFILAYTWSHEIDSASGFRQNNSFIPVFNPQVFRSSGDFDVRQYLTFSGGWDLPFSKGPQRLVKGWSLYPIVSWRTGFPFTVPGPLFTTNSNPGPAGDGEAGVALADLVAPYRTLDPKKNGLQLFNPNSFDPNNVTPPYGSSARNQFRLPGRTNFDLSLAKMTPLWKEGITLELRVDAFNVFNHTQFKAVDNNILDFGSTFGQITTTYDPRILQLAAHLRF